jgi:O-antigen ligase
VVWRHRRELAPGAATLHIVVFLLGGYALVMFATTVWATDAPLADARISEVVKALVICLLVASLSPSWKSLRRAMATLVVAAAAMSSLSIVQVATGHFIDIVGGLVAARMANIYGHTMGLRATGPPVLHDPNFYARILLIALPLGVVLALVQEKRARRIAYFAASAAIAGGILVTYSRGAMLALGMVIALLLLAMRVRARTLVAGAVGVVLLLPLMPGAVGKRLTTLTSLVPGDEDPAGEADESVQVRTLYGLSAVKMFEANPFAGVGAGNFGRHYDEYANVVGSTVYDYAPPGEDRYPHSLYLQIASETGLLGLAAFFATAAAAFHSLWRSRKRLLERGEEAHALLAVGLAISLFAYLVASAVLHESYLRYVAMVFGFVCAIARLTGTCAAEETDGDGVPASQQPALQPA